MSESVLPSGRVRRSRLLFAALGLLAVAAIGYGVLWHYLAARLERELVHWVGEQEAAGWKIATGAVASGGFPWHVVLAVPAPVVEDPSGNRWDGAPLTVSVPLFDPRHVSIESPGVHVVTPKGSEPLRLAAGGAAADLLFDGHGLERATIRLAVVAAMGGRLDRLDLDLRRLASGKVDHTVASWETHLALDNLVLPENPGLLFGPHLPSVRLDAHLQGSLPSGSLKEALAAWRDDGGTLEIDALSMDWPPLALSGKGTAALDSDMQPLLASTCEIKGLFPAIDALTRGGVIRGQDAGVIKLALGFMMKSGRDGQKTLTLPLSIQNRMLSIGPVKLFDVPPLPWK